MERGDQEGRRGGGQLEAIAQLEIEGEISSSSLFLSPTRRRFDGRRGGVCVTPLPFICSVREEDSSSPVASCGVSLFLLLPPPPPPFSLPETSKDSWKSILLNDRSRCSFPSVSFHRHLRAIERRISRRSGARAYPPPFSIILVVSPRFAYLSSPFSLVPSPCLDRCTRAPPP